MFVVVLTYPPGKVGLNLNHKANISEDTFAKIQKKLKRPERKPRETDNLEFPLRRVVDCDFCGKKMTGSVSRGKCKYYSHYTCNNKECEANPKNVTASKMEGDYLTLLRRITIDKEVLEMARVIAMRKWNQKVKDMDSGNAATQLEIKAIEVQIDEYIGLILTTRSESLRARYEAKVEGLDQRIKDLKESLIHKKNLTLKRLLSSPCDY